MYKDPETGDLAFHLSLPIIDANNIYRLKDVVNVGFWQRDTYDTYVKIHTPEVVACHYNNEQLYLAPNLKMCTLTKDIHFLCPSKPFVRDNTEGILPNQILWITVPTGSILHIDELALYHLTDDEYQAEIKISPFFKQHSFVLDTELEGRIKEEGTQLFDLTSVDTALEAIAHLPPVGAPIIRSCSAANTALCISTIVGYVVTLTLAFLLHKRVNDVQESINKCTSGVPCLFRRDKTDQEPEPENSTNLIELMPILPHRTPDN